MIINGKIRGNLCTAFAQHLNTHGFYEWLYLVYDLFNIDFTFSETFSDSIYQIYI